MGQSTEKPSGFWNTLTSYFDWAKKTEKAAIHEVKILKDGALHPGAAGKELKDHINEDLRELCKEAFNSVFEIVEPEADIAILAAEMTETLKKHPKGDPINHSLLKEIITETAERIIECPIKATQAARDLIHHLEEAGKSYEKQQAASKKVFLPR
ncbi:MAG: hypothetical protein MRY79_05750 [Alphaproteobacteria bacterium]|nr:hypothetical protein [Alphaproteobacteria bacterium]